jgi:ankyrin repeat protein
MLLSKSGEGLNLKFYYFISFFSLLIRAGVNINSIDNDGWTPLHAAAHWDKHDIIKYLIDRNADLEAKNYAVKKTKFVLRKINLLLFRDKHRLMFVMEKHWNY